MHYLLFTKKRKSPKGYGLYNYMLYDEAKDHYEPMEGEMKKKMVQFFDLQARKQGRDYLVYSRPFRCFVKNWEMILYKGRLAAREFIKCYSKEYFHEWRDICDFRWRHPTMLFIDNDVLTDDDDLNYQRMKVVYNQF